MAGLEEIAQVIGKEFHAIAGAPITFLTATVIIGCVIGLGLGFFIGELWRRSAWSKVEKLRSRNIAGNDLLDILRERHQREVAIREEIDGDFERLHRVIDRVHSGHTTTDRLISDATIATENAVEKLKTAHEEFLQRTRAWDEQRAHRPHADAASRYSGESTPHRTRSSAHGGD